MKFLFLPLRHKKRLFLLLIPVVVLTFIFWPRQSETIETQTVKSGEIIESLSTTGKIDSINSVTLSFLAGGKLVYLGAKKGDSVKAGQVIAILDQRTMQKNLETALRNYSLQRNTFEQTQEDNANRKPADALNDEMKRILQNNQYDLEKAVISVDLQTLAKEQSVLTTPITGIVIKSDVNNTGLNITAVNTFTIADPSNLTFKMDVDEADIGKIRQDQTIKLTLDAFPNETFNLSVNAIDFATHTTSTGGDAYTVEAFLPNSEDLHYRLGMNGEAEVIVNEKKGVLTVPLASIIDEEKKQFVYVKKDKSFEKREITVGLKNDIDTEVLSGLSEGDKIALSPDAVKKELEKKKFIFF